MVKAFHSVGGDGSEDYRVVDANGTSGIELDPDFLFSADCIRQGDDLLLRGGDGKEILIRDYFAQVLRHRFRQRKVRVCCPPTRGW